MRAILGLFGLLLLVILAVAFFKFLPGGKGISLFPAFNNKNHTVTINNHTFSLLIAQTEKDKEIGLSDKKSLPRDQAMLFPFDKPDYYQFWMKHMQFPIDIVYLRDTKVVTIYSNVQNPTFPTQNLAIYKPDQPADKVLEVNAGTVQKFNLKKGDSINLNF